MIRQVWIFFATVSCFFLLLGSFLIWGAQGMSEGQTRSSSLPQLEVIPMTPGIPLTTARVIAFVGVTAFAGGQTVSGKPPTILLVKAMSGQEAERIYSLEDLPDGPVIYVRLHGPFIIPHLLAHRPHMTPVPNVEEVFDATNGQIVDWGVFD